MSPYGQFTIDELEQKRTESYSRIDALRAELVAISREFEHRDLESPSLSLTVNRQPSLPANVSQQQGSRQAGTKKFFARLLGL